MEALKSMYINKILKSIKTRADEIEKEGEGIFDSPFVYAVRDVNRQIGIAGVPLSVPLAYAEYLNDKRVENKIDEIKELGVFFGTCQTDLLSKISKETGFSLEELKAIKKISEEGFDLLLGIHLPKIDKRLGRYDSCIQKPEFFRPYGPQWIDFTKGYITERKEVNEIINKFNENKNSVVIKGSPASGKSVILRNVGFKLAERGELVYIIELKKDKEYPESEFENLNRIGGYLLIDDVHLNTGYAEKILETVAGNEKVKVLMAIRKGEDEQEQEFMSKEKIDEYLKDAITVKSIDAREEIIKNFLKIEKKGERMPEEIKEKLSKASLWVLAWQLRAYKETGDVDRDAVCREVEHYLEKLTEQGIENAEDIFLILSVFYKYEIPVRRKFVEKLVCSSKKDIEKLIKIREINETKEKGRKYLGLHHSEIAGVYLDLFRNLEFEGVGEEMKKKVEEKTGKDWFEGLFHWYICEFPEECVMLGNLSHYEPELIKNLVEENFDMVKKGIEAEEDIGEIGWCIKGISEGSKGVAEKLIYILRDKIDFKEDLLGIGWCIKGISEGNKKLAEKLIPVVKDKIEAEEDIFSIDFCIRGIAVASKEFAEKLVNGLDFEILKDKIETEEEVFKIDVFIDGIDMRSKEIASNLVNQLDPEKAKTPEVRTEIIRLKKEYNLISNTR